VQEAARRDAREAETAEGLALLASIPRRLEGSPTFPLNVIWLIAGEQVRRSAGWGPGTTPSTWSDPDTGTQWSVGPHEDGVKVFETKGWSRVTEAQQSLPIFRNQLAEALGTLKSLSNEGKERQATDSYQQSVAQYTARKENVEAEIAAREKIMAEHVENEYLVTDAQLLGKWGPLS
jgi:hypothetical protein